MSEGEIPVFCSKRVNESSTMLFDSFEFSVAWDGLELVISQYLCQKSACHSQSLVFPV